MLRPFIVILRPFIVIYLINVSVLCYFPLVLSSFLYSCILILHNFVCKHVCNNINPYVII